jgi:colicin import membrane protein/protein TonB
MRGPATAFDRRDRLWPAVLVSVAVHGALIAAGVRQAGPAIDLEQKPIVAKLVRLGEPRPKEYLPRKEEPPTPAASAPEVVNIAQAAPAPEAKPRPPGARPSSTPTAGRSLSDVLSRVRREVNEDRYGDPQGDPQGDASDAEEGDRYLALAIRALQTNYRLPATISDQERLYLKATVVLYVEPDGRIARFRFEARSGNSAYDDALERAIRQTRLPPPPPEVRETYRNVGLGVKFHI